MKEKKREEKKRERKIEEKINREERHGARANRSCRLYLTLQTGERRRADSLFYCRVGREECVWLKFQSRSSLRLFGDERWNRGKKNRSTGDNNDESVHAAGRETDERNDEAGDRMPRVFPSTCDRDLSLRHFARCEFLFLNASETSARITEQDRRKLKWALRFSLMFANADLSIFEINKRFCCNW